MTCSVDGCDRPIRAQGWCDPHYQRWLRLGDAKPDLPIQLKSSVRQICNVGECQKQATRRGWCNTHYERWRIHGDVRKPDPPTYATVGDAAAYGTVHWRLRQSHGPAAAHRCVDCGNTAAQWSYDGGDVNEKRSPAGLLYSTDASFYSSRCAACHTRYDSHFGQDHRSSKLTDAQVDELREAADAGVSSVVLGAWFGISQTQAWNIARRRSRVTS